MMEEREMMEESRERNDGGERGWGWKRGERGREGGDGRERAHLVCNQAKNLLQLILEQNFGQASRQTRTATYMLGLVLQRNNLFLYKNKIK